MNTTTFLAENRENIIKRLSTEITRKIAVCGRAACDLKGAMIVFKGELEATQTEWKAYEAAEKAINGKIKVSKYFFLSESAQRQMGSSMK